MRLVYLCLFLFSSMTALGQDISNCSNPEGYSYYGNGIGSVDGWESDAITGGKTTFTKVGDNEYDILFIVDEVGVKGPKFKAFLIYEANDSDTINSKGKIIENTLIINNQGTGYKIGEKLEIKYDSY